MLKEQIQIGAEVKVGKNLKITDERCKVVPNMRKMIDKVYTIDRIREDMDIKLNGYWFAYEDVILVTDESKDSPYKDCISDPQQFDVQNLIIG